MAHIFNNISDYYFTLNGVKYYKAFVPLKVNDNSIRVVSFHDSRLVLLDNTSISDISVEGSYYTTAKDLIDSIIDIISPSDRVLQELKDENSKFKNELTQALNTIQTGKVGMAFTTRSAFNTAYQNLSQAEKDSIENVQVRIYGESNKNDNGYYKVVAGENFNLEYVSADIIDAFDTTEVFPKNWWYQPDSANGRYDASGTYVTKTDYYTHIKVKVKNGETIHLGYFLDSGAWVAAGAQYMNVWTDSGFTRYESGNFSLPYTATEDSEISFCWYVGTDGTSGVVSDSAPLNQYRGMITVQDTEPVESDYEEYFEPKTGISFPSNFTEEVANQASEQALINFAQSSVRQDIVNEAKTEAVSQAIASVNDSLGVDYVKFDNIFSDPNIYTVGKFMADRWEMRSKYVNENSKTIYLSQINGNNSNNGLSQDNPIATIAHAETLLNDGDTLLIERGSVFDSPTNLDQYDIPADELTQSGLKIDCYGSIDQPKPMFLNMETVPHYQWQPVSGYSNVYKYTHYLGANRVGSSSTHMMVQVMIDGEKLGSTVEAIARTSLSSALSWLQANPNNHWCSVLDNNGYNNGWDAGNYEYYISLSSAPTASQKIEISKYIDQLFNFGGDDLDVRNIAFRGNVKNVGLTLRNGFFEGLENYDFLRHGCYFTWGAFLNCKMISRGGGRSGFTYHHYSTNPEKDLVFIGCQAITKNGEKTGNVAFGGHSTTPITDDYNAWVYEKMVVIDPYVEGANAIIGGTVSKHNYIKNATVKDILSIASESRANVWSDGVFGNIKVENERKISVLTYPEAGKIHEHKNVFLKATLRETDNDNTDYSLFLSFADNDASKNYGKLRLLKSYIIFDLDYYPSSFNFYLRHLIRLGNDNIEEYLIEDSLIKWSNAAYNNEGNLWWGSNNASGFIAKDSNFAGINDSSGIAKENTNFFDTLAEFDKAKYLLKKSYVKNKRLQTLE